MDPSYQSLEEQVDPSEKTTPRYHDLIKGYYMQKILILTPILSVLVYYVWLFTSYGYRNHATLSDATLYTALELKSINIKQRDMNNLQVARANQENIGFEAKHGIVHELADLPCFTDRETVDVKKCSCIAEASQYNSNLYRLGSSGGVIDQRDGISNTVFVFIHLNKAGGTTIKRELLQRAAARHRWDGAAFGSYSGWQLLSHIQPENHIPLEMPQHFVNVSHYHIEEARYISCGRPVPKTIISSVVKSAGTDSVDSGSAEQSSMTSRQHDMEQPPLVSCELRMMWGALSLGLCDLVPGKPCIYFVMIRDPIERAISNYNYVCVQGAEHQKKWPKSWREKGYCPLNIVEYFSQEQRFANPNLLTERLSRGCTSNSAALEVARHNLFHPCVRYLLLERFEDGLAKLKESPVFNAAFRVELNNLLKRESEKDEAHYHRNKSPYEDRVTDQIENEEMIADLEALVSVDKELYEEAKRRYEEQWQLPITSCNTYR